MASVMALGANARRSLRADLERLAGVERAVVDEEAGSLWLLAEPGTDRASLQAAARGLLDAAGVDATETAIEIVSRLGAGDRWRMRFERVERIPERETLTRVRVALEWKGRIFTGEAVGEKGEAIEMRTAATAALRAIDQVIGQSLGLQLVGIKEIRAFDTELVVVSLYRSGPEPQRFVGAVLATADPLHSAAIAVLNALNRTLGNHLDSAS